MFFFNRVRTLVFELEHNKKRTSNSKQVLVFAPLRRKNAWGIVLDRNGLEYCENIIRRVNCHSVKNLFRENSFHRVSMVWLTGELQLSIKGVDGILKTKKFKPINGPPPCITKLYFGGSTQKWLSLMNKKATKKIDSYTGKLRYFTVNNSTFNLGALSAQIIHGKKHDTEILRRSGLHLPFQTPSLVAVPTLSGHSRTLTCHYYLIANEWSVRGLPIKTFWLD